jgi:hypothetical protein
MRVQSHTSIKLAQRCLLAYRYRYVERLQRAEQPRYLDRGKNLHALFELLYKGEVINHEDFDPEDIELAERYLAKYGDDPGWKVLAVEEQMTMKLGSYEVTFIPDLVVESARGEVWIVDHKTTANIPDEYDPYNMSDWQHLLYIEGLRQNGYNAVGFIFNYIRTKAPTQPKLIKDGSRIGAVRKMDTDFQTLYDFAKANGQLHDPDVQDKLSILKLTPDRYFQRHELQASDHAVKQAVADAHMVLEQLAAAEQYEQYPRHVLSKGTGYTACDKCEFQSLCAADLSGIDREPFMLDYVTREKK